MPIYVVTKRAPADGEKPRMVRADRRSQVESYLLGDFEIQTAGAEEGVELGAAGVKIEVATA